MLDRLILWLLVLLPVLTVAGAALYARWKRQAVAQRTREIGLWLLIGLPLLGGLIAWDLGVFGGETSAVHSLVRFRDRWLLLWLVPVYAIVLILQWRTLAGLNAGRRWLAFLFRSAILILIFLALAGLQMVVEKDVLSVVYVLDRSKSVTDGEAQRAIEWINATQEAKPADDKAGLIVFGRRAAAEVWPSNTFRSPPVKDLKSEIGRDATNLAEGIERGQNMFDHTTGKRLVIFSDGRENAGDFEAALRRLKNRGVDAWVVPLARSQNAEMLIEEIKVQPQLKWEEPFDARVIVQSNVSAKARVRLFTGDRLSPPPPPEFVELAPGKNVVWFRNLVLRTGGPHQIEALIEPLSQRDDTLAENNRAYTFTDVETESRILVLTSDLAEVEHLRKALEGEKISLDVRSGASLPENPEEYRRYDCIILANLARAFLSDLQMSVIESCVRDQGAGLVMIGGDQSFGAGQYLGTPIEAALPVSMELKNQKVMPSGALAIVLHTCEFADGNAWGKKISKAAINVLSPQDYAGLLYFSGPWGGTGERWLFKPTRVSRKQWMFSLIDGCEPGDMPNLDAIVNMGVNSLLNIQNVSLKHMIVITDGDPAPPSPATIALAKSGKITVTIVTIFPHGGADVSTMKSVAQQTGGRYYSADDPRKLPQIFIKEAAVVRKNLIQEDEKGFPVHVGVTGELLRDFGGNFPTVKAFVVTEPKAEAELHLFVPIKDSKMPVFSRWHYGLGKSVAFTSDATNKWGVNWVTWEGYKKFWAKTVRWVSRRRTPTNYVVNLPARDGEKQKVIVEGYDKQGNPLNFQKLVGTAVEPGIGEDLDAGAQALVFKQVDVGRYEAEFAPDKKGAYTLTVTDLSNPGKPSSFVTGMAVSYSDEFKTLDESGLKTFETAAAVLGKENLKDLNELLKQPLKTHAFVHDLPPVHNPKDFFWALLIAALCLFPFDVAVRRLHLDPLVPLAWLGGKLAPLLAFIKSRGGAVVDAASDAAKGKPAPPPLMPTGAESRAAQSRYEQAGGSAEAQGIDLRPTVELTRPKAVGGQKLTPVDEAASDYTRALLKAKRKAKKQ